MQKLIYSAGCGDCKEKQIPGADDSPLTNMHQEHVFKCMRTTLNIDDKLLEMARRYTGETEKTALVRMGLQALIEREASKRLAALGGSDRTAKAPPRRRLSAR